MKWFNNQKVFVKVLTLVGFLSVTTAGVAYIGHHAAYEMNERSDSQDVSANEVTKGYSLVLDAMSGDAVKFKKDFTEVSPELYKTADEKQKTLLDSVKAAAENHDAAKLEAVLKEYVDYSEKEERKASEEASATYDSSSRLLTIGSIAGILASLLGGYALAVYGLSRPTRKIVGVLNSLINNDLRVEITDTDRKDEIGELAHAAENFKHSLLKNLELVNTLKSLDKSQAVIEFNMDGTIVTANPNFLGALGYTLEEIKGRHHGMFVDEAYRNSAEYQEFWKALNRGEVQISEFKRVGKGGKPVYIQASYNPIPDLDGKAFKVIKFAIDVTERKLAELARVEAEKKELAEKEARAQKVAQLIAEFDTNATQTVSTVSSASTQLSQTAEQMSQIANDANRQSTEVASASQQASQNVQSVASAAEEMAATVQEISRQVSLSNDIVRQAMAKAEAADASSRELVDMSRAVGAIADLIENIAGQINLLALNATIESARSGEAGKGFAVVANEVKNLATQTAKATEQIRNQLDGVQKTAVNVADILGAVKESIGKVSESSTTIAAAVEEQSAATHEIVSNMSTATLGVEQINKGIFSIKGGTETTSQSTGQVLDAARMLSEQAERMDQEVKTFLRQIQTA